MLFRIIFLCALLIGIKSVCTAQLSFKNLGPDTSKIYFFTGIATYKPVQKTTSKTLTKFAIDRITVLPANFYTTHFGFFCRHEWKFEKITSLPFRFRLGSVQQVDRLEGKPNTALRAY